MIHKSAGPLNIALIYIVLYFCYSYTQSYYYNNCKSNFILHFLFKDSLLCSGLNYINTFIENIFANSIPYLSK